MRQNEEMAKLREEYNKLTTELAEREHNLRIDERAVVELQEMVALKKIELQHLTERI